MKRKLRNWRALFKKACFATLVFSFASGSQSDAQLMSAIGANNTSNGRTDYPCPLQDFYYATRAQYLYTEAELNAAGITAGATINSIGWDVTATFNDADNNNPIEMEDYSISLDTTLVSSLSSSSWEPGAVSFYAPTNYLYA